MNDKIIANLGYDEDVAKVVSSHNSGNEDLEVVKLLSTKEYCLVKWDGVEE